MRIAHIADIHLTDRKGYNGMTLDEQVELLSWIGQHAYDRDARVMLVPGDIFDHVSTPAMRNAAITVFARWAQHLPVMVVRGNHDRPGDLDFLGCLATKHTIAIHDVPAIQEIKGLKIACLPWPAKGWLAGQLERDIGQDINQAAKAAMLAILRGFAAEFEGSTVPCVLLGHAELGGASMDNGQPLAPLADMPLAAGDLLDTGADYIALGHIHKHQIIDDRICYAGSTHQTSFGCTGSKGYCLVDVERGKEPVIIHVEAPSRRLITYEGSILSCGEMVFGASGSHLNDAIRLVYECPEDMREKMRGQAETYKADLLEAGAHSVKIDARTTAVHRVRSDEIREAKTDEEKLKAWWASRDETPARERPILDKLAELGEVQS